LTDTSLYIYIWWILWWNRCGRKSSHSIHEIWLVTVNTNVMSDVNCLEVFSLFVTLRVLLPFDKI